MTFVYKYLAQKLPGIELKLKEARMPDSDEEYVKKTLMLSLFLSLFLILIIFLFSNNLIIFLILPIVWLFLFSYLARMVDLKISKLRKEIDKEILFAGRFLIIEIESGVPIYEAFRNLTYNYEVIGTYFSEIVDKIDLGTAMDDAINEVLITTPSPNLRKVLWQILNSIKTGSNVKGALVVVLEQVSKEQQIAIKEYGRKLNPIAMFYMMAAIIIPSLGITMLAVLASFIGLNISLPILLVIVVVVGFIQFMFLAVIKSTRPPMVL